MFCLYRLLIILLFCGFFSLSAEAVEIKTSPNTNRIVEGIISFAHWPRLQGLPVLCLSPNTRYYDRANTDNTIYSVKNITDFHSINLDGCNAIYFGQEPLEQQNQVISSLSGKNILTISESNSECVAGAAFCLKEKKYGFRFLVNLDSLTTSGVRVNSDVLMLSKDGVE